jgi:hypothetical protein
MTTSRRVVLEPAAEAAQLLERMVADVFNEHDPDRRAAAIGELFTDDVAFTDPDRTVHGRDGLATVVTGLLAEGAPDFTFTHAGPFRGVGELGMRAWSLGPAGGDAVAGGLDVILVAGGRIAHLWTVLDG